MSTFMNTQTCFDYKLVKLFIKRIGLLCKLKIYEYCLVLYSIRSCSLQNDIPRTLHLRLILLCILRDATLYMVCHNHQSKSKVYGLN